jgi:hypothetical protein
MTHTDFEKAYVALIGAERGTAAYQANFWAYDKLLMMCISDPLNAWTAVKAVLAYDSSPDVTSNLGAGPIEDLLVNHGASLIEQIEFDASQSKPIQEALRSVWQGDIDQEVWRRVKRARD